LPLDLKGRFNRFLPAKNVCRYDIAKSDEFHCSINEAGEIIEEILLSDHTTSHFFLACALFLLPQEKKTTTRDLS